MINLILLFGCSDDQSNVVVGCNVCSLLLVVLMINAMLWLVVYMIYQTLLLVVIERC
jgi:hypothetical protein